MYIKLQLPGLVGSATQKSCNGLGSKALIVTVHVMATKHSTKMLFAIFSNLSLFLLYYYDYIYMEKCIGVLNL